MRAFDLLRMAIHNLWQRRVRTMFNLTGIVTGCVVLLMTVAGASGVRNAIHALFDSSDFARQIYVFPGGVEWREPREGEIVMDAQMSEERRKRIRKALVIQWNQARQTQKVRSEITVDGLESIRKIPKVLAVIPDATTKCLVKTESDSLPTTISTLNFHSNVLEDSLLAGSVPKQDDYNGVLVDEFLAWQLGFRNDKDLPNIIGQTISIECRAAKNQVANVYNLLTSKWGDFGIDEFQKQTQFLQAILQLMGDLDKTSLSHEQKSQLRELLGVKSHPPEASPKPIVAFQFIVRGIVNSSQDDAIGSLFRQWFQQQRNGLLVHPDVAMEIYKKQNESSSFYNALVVVERSTHLEEVTEALRADLYQPQSSLAILQNIDRQIDQSSWIVLGIAIAILLTSAVGIFNTLTMSVVERTPEFGIMKSIGARDSHVMKLMIVEGAIVGMVGALVAVVLSILLGAVGQSILKYYVESRMQTEIAGKLFQPELLPIVLIFPVSVSLCILASILPAWRAAKLDPVVAMRRM